MEGSGEYAVTMDASELENLKKEKFQITKFDQILREITKDLSDINPQLFWRYLIEILKIFNEMSSALSLAFQGS